MKKLLSFFTLAIALQSFCHTYSPYSFQFTSISSTRILNEDIGLVWKFAEGLVSDRQKKKEGEFFTISIKDIFDSLIYQAKTKESWIVISREHLQHGHHNLLIAELTIRDNHLAEIGLVIQDNIAYGNASSKLDSINIQLDHGMYLNALPWALDPSNEVMYKELHQKYYSGYPNQNINLASFRWAIVKANDEYQFIKKPVIVNVRRLEKLVNKFFRNKYNKDESLILKAFVEHCFITKFLSTNIEIAEILNQQAYPIALRCENELLDQFNIHLALQRNKKKYRIIH